MGVRGKSNPLTIFLKGMIFMSKKKDKELQTTITKWGVEVDENGEYVNFHPSICIKKYLSRHPIVIKDRLNYYAYDKEMYCWQKVNLEDIVKNIHNIIDRKYPDKWVTSLDYDWVCQVNCVKKFYAAIVSRSANLIKK